MSTISLDTMPKFAFSSEDEGAGPGPVGPKRPVFVLGEPDLPPATTPGVPKPSSLSGRWGPGRKERDRMFPRGRTGETLFREHFREERQGSGEAWASAWPPRSLWLHWVRMGLDRGMGLGSSKRGSWGQVSRGEASWEGELEEWSFLGRGV